MPSKAFILAATLIAAAAWNGHAAAAGRHAGHRTCRLAHRAGHAHGGARHVAAGAQTGRASFYVGGGHATASGGHVGEATCAHRFLPFGTRVLVTNLANAHRMVLTVNDRGPFVRGRLVDVSRAAAAALGMIQSGVATVRMEVIGRV